MKRRILLLLVLFTLSTGLDAQTKSHPIKESEVPEGVKQAFNDALGYPVEEWIKFSVNESSRYVAVFKLLDPSTGKIIQNRYRYTNTGWLTSFSQYRGNGRGVNDFLQDYLGEVYEGTFKAKLDKVLKENTLISFEAFYFVPGNQNQEHPGVYTNRFVVMDKKGKRFAIYYDYKGVEVDITKYPVRRIEAEELDEQG